MNDERHTKDQEDGQGAEAPDPQVVTPTSEGQEPEAGEQPPVAEEADAEEYQKPAKGRKGGKKTPDEEAVEMRLLRLQADFDNFRKRTLREKNDLYTRANEDLLQELVPVLDHLELALKSAREHGAPQALLDGFGLVYEQFLTVLKKFQVTVIDAAGAQFDPAQHEAISHLSSPDVREGDVIAQVRKGYLLGTQLLRPAQVVVSSGLPKPADSQ